MNKQLREIASYACNRAKKAGAQQAAASVRLTRFTKVVIRDGKLEEIKAAVSRGLSLRLFVDGRYGSHATSGLDRARLDPFIDGAVSMTRFLMPDRFRSLPDPKHYQGRSTADLQLYDPAQDRVTTAERKRLALALYEAARQAGGAKVISVGTGCYDSVSEQVLVHTNGFADGEKTTSFGEWADVSVRDPSGKRPSDWAQGSSRHRARLPAPAAIGALAARRALGAIGADKIASIELPVIVENRAVGRILGGLTAPMSGRALNQKRSCLEGREGQVITAALFSMVDDPLLPAGFGSRRYDWEGLTTKKRPIVDKGVFKTFYIDTYYGKKLGREPTTLGSSNLIFPTGTLDLDGLCRKVGKAVLITRFIGGNSNATTGDFSHGFTGFLIENGRRTRALASMNVAGNHLSFWKGLQALGNDPYPYSSARTPSLLFGPVLVSGK